MKQHGISPHTGSVVRHGFSGGLDLYEDAIVALSAGRKLTDFANKCMRIRRASDNAETDIAFVGGNIDEQAINDLGGYNLLGYTEDLNNNIWNTFGSGTGNLQSGISDPFGGNGAYRFSASGGEKILSQIVLQDIFNGDQFNGSLYYRNSSSSGNKLRVFRSGSGVVESSVINLSQNDAEWRRVNVTRLFQNNQTGVRFDIYVASGFSVEVFAPQLTKSSNLLPYQPRTAGGASDCFVATLYDQSGNNNHATQTVADAQPKIYDVASGEVSKENGKPAMVFDVSHNHLFMPNVAGRSNIDAYFVIRHDFGSTIYPFGTNSIVGGTYGFVVQQNSQSTSIINNYGNPNLYKNNTLFTGTTRDDIYNFLGQTQNIVNHQGANVSSWNTFNFGNFPSDQFHFEGTLQEIIIFDRNLTTQERQALHSDINTYYEVY
jgi:hypothetical protein